MRKRGRAAECTRLESESPERVRGFESLRFRSATRSIRRSTAKLCRDARAIDQRRHGGDAAFAEAVEDVLREDESLAVRREAEEVVLRCAVEDETARHLVAAGDDDVRVEGEIGNRGDVGGDQVLVLTARHDVTVVRHLVVHVLHEIVEAPFVESAKVRAIAGLEVGVGHAGRPYSAATLAGTKSATEWE